MKYLKLFEKFNVGEIIDDKYEIMQIFNPNNTKDDDQLEYIAKYNDNYYLKSDFVTDINGDNIPESLAVFSNNRDAYILRKYAVEYNGDWYPEGEVPTEETNVEDTQQPQDITE